MNLSHFGHNNSQLKQLLGLSARWYQLDGCLKQGLPTHLRSYCRVACVRDGCLVVLAQHNMAASRLRMVLPALLPTLQQVEPSISSVRVKVQLLATPKPAVKRAVLSPTARAALAKSAQALRHHPELARALQHLSDKQD